MTDDFRTDSDKPVHDGYTYKQLNEAFDRVKDPKNWKNPIKKKFPSLTQAEQDLINSAVIYFAGCGCEFVPIRGGIAVTAIGYYMAVGS